MQSMSFRSITSVTLVAILAGCGAGAANGGAKHDSASGAVGGDAKHPDSAGGAIATEGAGAATADTTRGTLAANHNGRIPVLEYHVIGGDKNSLYTRTAAS